MTTDSCVDTIATLKTKPAGFAACSCVLGYHKLGDGGGGTFYWDADSSDPDNLGTVIEPEPPTPKGRWKRLIEGPLSVKWFGAGGHGDTQDDAAIQAAVEALPSSGGTVSFPPGSYLLRAPIVVSGTKRVSIIGYGAELKTEGEIYALEFRKVGDTVYPTLVAGLTIDQDPNETALGAVLVEQSWNVRLRDITVVADGLGARYVGAIVVQGADPAIQDTGSFWTRIENVWIRKLGRTDNPAPSIPAGVVLRDSANATVISGGGINHCIDGVLITTRILNEMTINAVLVESVAFESCGTAVAMDGEGSNGGGGSGLRVIGCRGENLDAFLKITNRGRDFWAPPVLFGNYLATSIPTYVEAPEGVTVVAGDFMLAPNILPPELHREPPNGTLTISGAAKSAPVTFHPPFPAEADAGYFVSAIVTGFTGSPKPEAKTVFVEETKTTESFVLVLGDAPGMGNTVSIKWQILRFMI
jgi:hypothetical protein